MSVTREALIQEFIARGLIVPRKGWADEPYGDDCARCGVYTGWRKAERWRDGRWFNLCNTCRGRIRQMVKNA